VADEESKQDDGASQAPKEGRQDDASQAPEERRTTKDPKNLWDPLKRIVLLGADALEAGQHETLSWEARAFVWVGEIAVFVYRKYRC
jgi:hypothetical protein